MKEKIKRFNDFPGVDDTYFLLIALLLAFGTLQTAGTVLDTERPVVSVISPSMCPAIQVGDILVVQGTDYSELEEQDIIVYDVPDRAELTIDGQNHLITGEGNSTETPYGTLTLQNVVPASDRRNDGVMLSLAGQDLRDNGEILIEGRQYIIDGKRVEIDYATSLPRGETPIVHRIVEKSEDHVETMGDANAGQIEFEQNVRPSQIYGRMIFKIPRLGLLKLVAMDFIGYQGDQPFILDATPSC